MTRDVVTVRAGTSVEGVQELMLQRGLSRVPVVDDLGRLLGVVSKTDLVEKLHDESDTIEQPDTPGFHVHGEGVSVEDVMTKGVMAVGESASIERAAEMMVFGHVHGLPVVTLSGRLIGFVSATEVLGWLCGLR